MKVECAGLYLGTSREREVFFFLYTQHLLDPTWNTVSRLGPSSTGKINSTEVSSAECHQGGLGLELFSCEERPRDLGLFSLGKRWLG